MRTDIKVGAIIAVVLALVAVVTYFGFYWPGREPQQAPPEPRVERPAFRPEPATRPVPDVDIGYRPTPHPLAPTPGTTPGTTPATRPIFPSDVPIRIGPTSGPSDMAYRPLLASMPAAERPYVVKPGDTYWSIAAAEYGDGSMYVLLERANPNVPARSLRAGITIKIPPKPTAAIGPASPAPGSPGPAAPGAPAVAAGSTSIDPDTGKRFYIVKAGDNPSTIAQQLYGDQRMAYLIVEANPGLNAKTLRVGQKLWAPTRPGEAPTPAPGTGLIPITGVGGTRPSGMTLPAPVVPRTRPAPRPAPPTPAPRPAAPAFD